jgi:hypothetical protein
MKRTSNPKVDSATALLQKYFLQDGATPSDNEGVLRAHVIKRFPLGLSRNTVTTELRLSGAHSDSQVDVSSGDDAICYRINYGKGTARNLFTVLVSYDVRFLFDDLGFLYEINVARHLTGL